MTRRLATTDAGGFTGRRWSASAAAGACVARAFGTRLSADDRAKARRLPPDPARDGARSG